MTALISLNNVVLGYPSHLVLNQVTENIYEGEIFAIIGGSGSGKSTLLKSMVGLIPVLSGEMFILGHPLHFFEKTQTQEYYKKVGFLFQEGALFNDMTVLENIAYPLYKLMPLSYKTATELALLKLALVGLEQRVAFLKPMELSGGMKKRVGLARALALDPEIVFLDEPTSGLDPESAAAFDALIQTLKSTLGITVVMVTHDLSTMKNIVGRFGMIVRKKLITGTLPELYAHEDPDVRAYFHSPRAEEIFKKSHL